MDRSICRSRLTIVTQNSTVLLKCLLWNTPVMCYWDEVLSPLNEKSSRHFKLLKDAGILHKDAASLSDFVSTVDIEDWWNSDYVQSAKIKFCQHYVHFSFINILHAMRRVKGKGV